MVSKGLALPADGHFSSPVCLVKQKGKHRLVVDYQNVNKSVELSNKAYLPTIQSRLQKILRGAILSSVDLVSAFWQFSIDEETSQRLAMAKERGPFCPTHLPFGLVSSPSEMCAQMQKIMLGFSKEHLIQYMDDLFIFSTDLDKLIKLTADLLKCFYDYGLKIHLGKSHLFCTKARVLGHDVNPEGIHLLVQTSLFAIVLRYVKNARHKRHIQKI